jgi:hypothetical protein
LLVILAAFSGTKTVFLPKELRHVASRQSDARHPCDDFLCRGLPPQEAKLAARRAYGGVDLAKELHRDAPSFVWLEQTAQDLRHAARSLSRSPGFALLAILTLALGVGVNSTLFTAYDAVALRPLPVTAGSR